MLMITASQRQATLDGSFTRQPCIAPFSSRGLIDHLVKLVLSEDEVFTLLEKPAFRHLLHYLHPGLASSDMPHRTKIHKEVLQCAVQAESNLKATLQVCST